MSTTFTAFPGLLWKSGAILHLLCNFAILFYLQIMLRNVLFTVFYIDAPFFFGNFAVR